MRFLSTVAFRAIKTKSTMGFDIPVDLNIHSYQNPVNSGSCYSCRLLVSELSKSCQQSKLTFLSIVAFKGSKILSIVKVDISVDNSYQHWQLICLLTVTFRITQILLTVGVDTTVDRIFQIQRKPGRRYASSQLPQLRTVALGVT